MESSKIMMFPEMGNNSIDPNLLMALNNNGGFGGNNWIWIMFDIKGDKISLNTEDLAIPPFKDHYNGAKDKFLALKEIEYIVWLNKWNTPYEAYPIESRAKIVAKDVFGDENYVPTEDVKTLERRFLEFQETPGTRLLDASKAAAEGIMATLKEYSKDAMDIDTAIKASRILKDVGNIVKSLDIAAKQAKSEQAEAGRVKGGGIIGRYEIPR